MNDSARFSRHRFVHFLHQVAGFGQNLFSYKLHDENSSFVRMSTRKLRSRSKIDYRKMAEGDTTEIESGNEVAIQNINNNNNKPSSVSDDGGNILGTEIFNHESDSLDEHDEEESSDSEKDVSELELSNVEKKLESMRLEEKRLKKLKKYRRLSAEAKEVEKSIKKLKKEGKSVKKGGKKVTNVTLRGMKDVMEEVDRLMDDKGIKKKKAKKQEKKQESSTDTEEESETSSSSDSSEEEVEVEEKKPKKQKKESGKLKSGKSKQITSDVRFPQDWPQSYLSLHFVNQDKKYEDLTLSEFCAGYVTILEHCKGSELTHRTAHLKELMYLSTQYQWRCVLNYHAAVLVEIERGYLQWDGNFQSLQNATLAGGFLNSQQQRGPGGSKRGGFNSNSEGVVFCRDYQTSTCTHTGDHKGDFRGESRMLKHICAKCWLVNRKIAPHAEKSGVCPLDS